MDAQVVVTIGCQQQHGRVVRLRVAWGVVGSKCSAVGAWVRLCGRAEVCGGVRVCACVRGRARGRVWVRVGAYGCVGARGEVIREVWV